jgi:hypothetical protein
MNKSIYIGTKKIGIILAPDLDTDAVPPLKFLLLKLNSLQRHFEYAFFPALDDPFILSMREGQLVDRQAQKKNIPEFLARYNRNITSVNTSFKRAERIPEVYILVTLARYSDEYYLTGNRSIGIIALGNWKRYMAPPSLLELILTMVVVESVYLLRELPGIGHLGTKGCLFDFNASLDDARYGALQSYVCSHCRAVLEEAGHNSLADDLVKIMDKSWFGSPTDNLSVAGVIGNFKYDLFLTKGIKPTGRERFSAFLQEDGMKELFRLIAEVLLAAALLYLGLKKA